MLVRSTTRGTLCEWKGVATYWDVVTGDPALEATYREWIPVVEIGGERAFVYYLDEAAFRRKLSQGG